MNLGKYRNKLIISIIFYAFVMVIFLVALTMPSDAPPFSKILPGNDIMWQFAFLFLFLSFFSMLGVISGYLLSPLYLIIHKKIIGRKYEYSVQDIPASEKSKSFNWLYSSLIATNLAMMLTFNPTIQDVLMLSTLLREDVMPMLTLAVLYMITLPIAIALFSSAFFLFENGFIISTEEKVREQGKPIEVKAVGSFYLSLLKGYAGIGVIIAYMGFVQEMVILQLPHPERQYDLISILIVLPIFPILIMFASIPAILLSQVLKNHRKKFLLRFASKIEISKKSQLSIKYID